MTTCLQRPPVARTFNCPKGITVILCENFHKAIVINSNIGHNMKGCARIYNMMMNFNQNIIIEIQGKWEEI